MRSKTSLEISFDDRARSLWLDVKWRSKFFFNRPNALSCLTPKLWHGKCSSVSKRRQLFQQTQADLLRAIFRFITYSLKFGLGKDFILKYTKFAHWSVHLNMDVKKKKNDPSPLPPQKKEMEKLLATRVTGPFNNMWTLNFKAQPINAFFAGGLLVFRYRKWNARRLLPASDYCRALFLVSGCVPLGWSRSGSVIQDHSDHGASKEPMNPWSEWIRRFLWCNMIRVILDHWSGFGSPQRNAAWTVLSDLITARSAVVGYWEKPPGIWLTVAF